METETPIYKVFFLEDEDYVTMEWSGYANSTQFREGTEKMFEELTAHKSTKVLGNIKDMVLISAEDQLWLHEQFLPRAIAGGFKAIALVRPIHYFNNVAIESIVFKINQDALNVQVFNNLEDAKYWLKNLE
ncbi:MAG: hypothetical protein V4565_01965 [Bacteroidota bacterium]